MPGKEKSKKKSNADLMVLSKKMLHYVKKLTEETFKRNLIQSWNLQEDEKSFPLLELTRQYIIESAWKDCISRMGDIVTEITFTVAEPQFANKLSVFNDDLNFIFNKNFIYFRAHVDFEKNVYDAMNIRSLLYTCAPVENLTIANTPLLDEISLTNMHRALKLIKAGADVNNYSPYYGDNPLLLAVTKGWNHLIDETPEPEESPEVQNQEEIIEALLAREDLDVNAVHAKNGMTALHIACLRGDEPSLIELLLQRGALLDCKDCRGKTPADYLDSNYAMVMGTIVELTDGFQFREHKTHKPNQSHMATLPAEEERARNILLIKKIFNRVLQTTLEEPSAKRPKF